MSIVLEASPQEITFSRNPVVFRFKSDALYQLPGEFYSGKLVFDYNMPDNQAFTLSYGDIKLDMVIKSNPDDSGYQIINRQVVNADEYAQILADGLNANYYLNRDFKFSVGGNGIDFWVVVDARERGTVFNLSLGGTAWLGLGTLRAGADRVANKNFMLYYQLWVENAAQTDFIKVSEAYLPTDLDGRAALDLSAQLTGSLLDDGYIRPDLTSPISTLDRNYLRRYYLRYAEVYGDTQVVKKVVQSDMLYSMLGGISNECLGEFIFPGSFIAGSKLRFLKQEPVIKTIRPDQPEFLTLVTFNQAFAQLQFCTKIYYTDGTNITIPTFTYVNVAKYTRLTFPAGFMQNNLHLIDPSRQIEKYEIYLVDDQNQIVTETKTYWIDGEYQPYVKFLVYLGSLGTYDTQVTYGKGSNAYELVTTSADISRVGDFSLMDGDKIDFSTSLNNVETLTTGYRLKSDIRLFRDLFLSRDKFIVRKGRAYPITLASKEIAEFKDGDNNFALTFDIGFQYDEQLYTVDDKDDQTPAFFFANLLGQPNGGSTLPADYYDYRYYLKSQTYTQAQVNQLIQQVQTSITTFSTTEAQHYAALLNAIAGKADIAHDHDDRYIPRAEMNDLLDRLQKFLDDGGGAVYLYASAGDDGLAIDGQGRVTFQHPALVGKTGYIVEASQLNAKFSHIDGADLSYNVNAGSFTILVPGFTLSAGHSLIIWPTRVSTGDDESPLIIYNSFAEVIFPIKNREFWVLQDETKENKKSKYAAVGTANSAGDLEYIVTVTNKS